MGRELSRDGAISDLDRAEGQKSEAEQMKIVELPAIYYFSIMLLVC